MHFSFPDGNAVRINCHDSDSLLAEVRQRLTDGRGFAIATINVDHLQRLADEAETGFGGVEVARDRAGFAAIVRNAAGQMMLVRAHGNHFAARPVDAAVVGRLDKDFLTLTTPEKRFGAVTLQLGKDAGMWASRMRELKHG